MKVLVVGSGGREHALAWKLKQSSLVDQVCVAPGNGGTALLGENVDIAATDIPGLLRFVQESRVDITVIGPEAPLVEGIVDRFQSQGFPCFGPSRDGSRIEGSKIYAKELMVRHGIPTSRFEAFDDREKARRYLSHSEYPAVVKADGLAAGKGVMVVQDVAEAHAAIDLMMVERKFGEAGSRVIIEEHLEGEEASIVAITDGSTILPLIPSQDHKPIFDGDRGPNTGGMGAYAPVDRIDESLLEQIEEKILVPVVGGLRDEGVVYRGAIYAGLMLTDEGPKVLEFNCRFGDPETQPVLPLLKSDFGALVLATLKEELSQMETEWEERYGACVVVSSGGYPMDYEKGKRIRGLEDLESMEDVQVFHAGTTRTEGNFITSGGRVLGVTGLGTTLDEAVQKSYQAVARLSFEKMYYRKDIGSKGLRSVRGK